MHLVSLVRVFRLNFCKFFKLCVSIFHETGHLIQLISVWCPSTTLSVTQDRTCEHMSQLRASVAQPQIADSQ